MYIKISSVWPIVVECFLCGRSSFGCHRHNSLKQEVIVTLPKSLNFQPFVDNVDVSETFSRMKMKKKRHTIVDQKYMF